MVDIPGEARTIEPSRPRGGRLTLAFDGGTPITIDSETDGVLTWLADVLAPGFAVLRDDCVTALRVLIAAGDARDEGDTLESSFPCFALDSEVLRLPGRSVGSAFVVRDDNWGTRIEVGPERVHISPSRLDARVRAAALRVVREMATVRALAAGDRVQLHASCIAWKGGCLVLAGPKRAGKTTLLAKLAASTGAEIVANDRVILRPTELGWHVTGVPTVVSVRPGTMRRLPDLFRTVPSVARPIDLTLHEAELASSRFGTVSEPSRLALSPVQLASEVGSKLSPGGPLARLAIIGVDSHAADFHVHRLSRREAAEAIDGVRYGANAGADGPTVFERVFGSPLRGPVTAQPGPDLATSPWVRIGIGERFLTSPSAPQKLLQTLFER